MAAIDDIFHPDKYHQSGQRKTGCRMVRIRQMRVAIAVSFGNVGLSTEFTDGDRMQIDEFVSARVADGTMTLGYFDAVVEVDGVETDYETMIA